MPSQLLPPRTLWRALAVAVGCLSFLSCEKKLEQPSQLLTSAQPYAVSEGQARAAAENIALSPGVLAQVAHREQTGDTQRVFQGRQQILSFSAVPAADGQPGLYLCNYTAGGFAIVAADRHLFPILAFAEHGALPVSKLRSREATPGGVAAWLEATMQATTALRQNPTGNPTQKGAAAQWNTLTDHTQPSATAPPASRPAPDPEPAPCYSIQVGPMLQTTWGQGCVYNSETPAGNNANNCNHCPTGCVATATTQVMKFWQYPTRYNWANMPPNQGNYDIAVLMHEVGVSLNMDYGDDESGTDDDYIDDKLKSPQYGYRYAEFISDETGMIQRIRDDMRGNRPVIIGGSPTTFFGYGIGGHCWVTDGYIDSFCDGYGYLYFHMNWGWRGDYNGWFSANNWQVTDSGGNVHNYNYAKTCTINIHP